MKPLDRRSFVRVAGAGVLTLPVAAGRARARTQRRLLVFTKSSGFVHSPVRSGPDGLCTVDRALITLGREHGFHVTATKDGSIFSSPDLPSFDAFFFVTTGDLTEPGNDGAPPMTAEGKQALLNAVAGGKGFVGVHNATDTFTHPESAEVDPYIAMVGGEFVTHGAPQRATVRVVDPQFPGLPDSPTLERMGEWYVFTKVAADLSPLLILETDGMAGEPYRRDPYPIAWTRLHGSGRVAYNGFGHFDDEWSDGVFPSMLLGMIRWAFGDA